MNTEQIHIENLINRMLAGEANISELNEIATWAKQSDSNQKYLEDSKKAWSSIRRPFLSDEIMKDHSNVISQIRRRQYAMRTKKTIRLFYRTAAILSIPILLALGWLIGYNFNEPQSYAVCEVVAPKGQIAECTLADGTRVWINAGSSIQYNPSLSGKNRVIKLSGEAYFKVTKNIHKPFIVETRDVFVKVLGTSFNVKAYPDQNITETTLEEGLVELTLTAHREQNPIELSPGEHAIFDPVFKEIEIEKADTYLLTAWREGKYIFKDADLNTLIKQLEKLYDVRIYLKNKEMGEIRFRGTFEYKQNILDALETIERTTSLKYKMDGRNIWFETKN